MKRWKLLTLILTGLISISFLYGWALFNKKTADTAIMKADFKMEASELIKAFEADELNAGNRYNDKVISITGIVSSVSLEDSVLNVVIEGDGNTGAVLCQFSKNYAEAVKKIPVGKKIRTKGVCTGMLLDVVLVRCVPDPAI